MEKEVIVTGKTIADAITKANLQYASEGEISVEILETPKKGFFGIGGSPAKIKVTVKQQGDDIDIDDIVKDVKNINKNTISDTKSNDKNNHLNSIKNTSSNENKSVNNETVSPEINKDSKVSPAEKIEKEELSANKKRAHKKEISSDSSKTANVTEKTQQTEQIKKEPENVTDKSTSHKKERTPIIVSQAEMDYAVDFLNTLLKNMNVDAKAKMSDKPSETGEGVYPEIEIIGQNAGILIGHHGETLDAIQYLTNLCANRKTKSSSREFVKIIVDIENYRAKREETLKTLAHRMADKAKKYKRNFVLEPMNPYERRLIHSELQEEENISTHSVGSDENRKVVITYDGPDKVERRSKSRSQRSNHSQRKKSVNSNPAVPSENEPEESLIEY